MTNYDKNEELSDLKYWDIKKLYGYAVLQTLPVVNDFKWVEGKSQFNQEFIKKLQ